MSPSNNEEDTRSSSDDSIGPTRVARKVRDIPNVPYGINDGGKIISMEPSADDIRIAISNGQLEKRGFQADLDSLRAEWIQQCNGDLPEFYRLQGVYHARRVAFFVVNRWNDPITLKANGQICDGLHRLKAAIFLGLEEVDVSIEGKSLR